MTHDSTADFLLMAAARSTPRILYLTRVYPYRPAFGGEISYSRGVLESVARACDLTVLATTNGVAPVGRFDADGIHWLLVPQSRRPQALSLTTGMPNVMWRNATHAYHAALARLLKQDWDGIILDHFASAHVLPKIVAWRQRHPNRRLLYVSHEFERTTRAEKYASYGGNLARTAAMKVDGWKIGRWEDRVLNGVDIISLINPNERHFFEERVAGKTYINTVPGYDEAIVPYRNISAKTQRRIALLGGRGSIHKQNILREWLAAAATPFAAAGITLDVIGDVGTKLQAELQTRHPTVTFSGFVEDLPTHLQQSRLGIVPDTVGRGVKVRLTSYIFSRVPLAGITGAIDGLPLQAGRDFREAPDPAALTRLCIDLIDNLPLLNQLQNAAFDACYGKFNWADRGVTIVEALTKPSLHLAAEATPTAFATPIRSAL